MSILETMTAVVLHFASCGFIRVLKPVTKIARKFMPFFYPSNIEVNESKVV